MKPFLSLVLFTSVFFMEVLPAFADVPSVLTRAEVVQMMSELKAGYEAQIKDLNDRIDDLAQNQEARATQQKTEVKAIEGRVEKMNEQYNAIEQKVGRYEGPFEQEDRHTFESGFGEVSVGGYADIEYENFEDSTSTFDQHRWIINIGALVHDQLRFYSEYEIEHGGNDASGGGESKVEQAWIDYLINDAINFRAGALLVPFGRYNLYHDSHLQDLTDRPLVIRRIIPSTWTEAGAGLHGEFNPAIGDYEDLEITYEAYAINGINTAIGDSGFRDGTGSIEADNNNDKSVVGRVTVSPALGHEVGFSGYYGDYNNADSGLGGLGLDFFSSFGPLELLGEGAFFWAEDPAVGDTSNQFGGFYLQANYHFWPAFLDGTFLKGNFDNPTLTWVSRYGYIFLDDDGDANTGDNKAQRFTFGLNYRPVESWVLKVEYQINQKQNESLERGSNNGVMASAAMGF